MIELTSKQWAQYEEQYTNLMWRITQLMSGDEVLTNKEDSYAELCLAALESIHGFFRKVLNETEVTLTFDTMWAHPKFDAYTKTCLWNSKNHRGKKIAKKMPMLARTFSMSVNTKNTEERDNLFQIESKDTPDNSDYLKDAYLSLNREQSDVLDALVTSDDHLKHSGKVNVQAVARALSIPWIKAKRIVQEIASVIGTEL